MKIKDDKLVAVFNTSHLDVVGVMRYQFHRPVNSVLANFHPQRDVEYLFKMATGVRVRGCVGHALQLGVDRITLQRDALMLEHQSYTNQGHLKNAQLQISNLTVTRRFINTTVDLISVVVTDFCF